ncbi:uncharacterized protein PV07_00725 [Cladophialophora immunda]|uniref:Xylanolytic transcriptional activator regulatory domain-containing protein n=1 Tax=Cladophialophora immunda TaxID=569365 RepID=A0A0D2A0F2_9EURO|nr:uncharacterized protein PV07_00725 [Cladophialophora immunda]KIW33911.1 hypothetical protein PV07_00725 [Cladophialophora immunda]
MHPSHESCSPGKRSKDDSPRSIGHGQQGSHVAASCYSLGFPPDEVDGLANQFFENFTSFQLFRERDFLATLQNIETASQCKALLAAIMIFATKDQDQCDDGNVSSAVTTVARRPDFINQTLKYVDQAIYECEDMPLSLPLLQTVILVAHWLLTQGVRGRAWRYLRVAISSAYELNMHLIDANCRHYDKIDPSRWVEEEERRRAWWAIWEMDAFASVIRRCPTGIDWSQNETFLPCEDHNWQQGVPQKSCTLRQDILERYKALEASGNQSPKAWFIVINSLMKDAQSITSPIGVDTAPAADVQSRNRHKAHEFRDDGHVGRRVTMANKNSLSRLCTIRNALQCTVMALPKPHRYRHHYLSFGIRELDRHGMIKKRLQHSYIYSIHAMVQLTKLMIYKYHLFQATPEEISRSRDNQHSIQLRQSQALEQYSEATDEIVFLVNSSYEEHYKYVNPFLANTIWLAGAVQLLYRELAPLSSSDKSLTNSKLEVLSMSYNRFVGYWNMSSTLQKNLEVVQSEILNIRKEIGEKHADDGLRTNQPTPPRTPVSRPSSRSAIPQGCDQFNQGSTGSHGTASDFSECYPQRRASTLIAQRPGLSAIAAGSIRPQNVTHGFDSIDPCTYGNGPMTFQETTVQQTAHCGIADGQIEPLIDSTSTAVQQLPMLVDSVQANDLVRQSNSLSFANTNETQSDLSPDFLSELYFPTDLIGSSNHLSNYFGEILSGGGMV